MSSTRDETGTEGCHCLRVSVTGSRILTRRGVVMTTRTELELVAGRRRLPTRDETANWNRFRPLLKDSSIRVAVDVNVRPATCYRRSQRGNELGNGVTIQEAIDSIDYLSSPEEIFRPSPIVDAIVGSTRRLIAKLIDHRNR
jgi:hypothetical protein